MTPHYCSPLSASRPWADPRLHHFMIQFLHWRLYSDDNYSRGAGGVWSTARYITTGDPQLSGPLLILHLFNNFLYHVCYVFYFLTIHSVCCLSDVCTFLRPLPLIGLAGSHEFHLTNHRQRSQQKYIHRSNKKYCDMFCLWKIECLVCDFL